MFGFGPWELVLVLIVVIFFYGGSRLPKIGEGLGRGIQEFKRGIKDSPAEEGAEKQLTKQ